MSDPIPIPTKSPLREQQNAGDDSGDATDSYFGLDVPHTRHDRSSSVESLATPGLTPGLSGSPSTPDVLSSTPQSVNGSIVADGEDLDTLPPLDRLTVFDFLENLALPQRLEKIQNSIQAQTERVRRQRDRLKNTSAQARDKVVDEWRRRVPPPDERLAKYKKRVKASVERLTTRWHDRRSVSLREKISFIAGTMNIFLSGYILGSFPDKFYLWYTAQFIYFYPLRFFMYRRRGMGYFLADLCYFVNFLVLGTLWAFPQSKRLFISAFCLAFGNNAVAIIMWRNSLVYHSFDKVTSLFIHIMPCVTLHSIVHLQPKEVQRVRFPAVYTLRFSEPGSPAYYGLVSMAIWSSVPYALWQITYYFMISVRQRDKISAGKLTSFTWLRKSYSKTWIGKFVLRQPESLQEATFIGIQYVYALLTMAPAPIWFHFRWASVAFLVVIFIWSTYNGANYYIEVFGVRFQKELEALKKDVAKWQMSPELMAKTPTFDASNKPDGLVAGDFSLGAPAVENPAPQKAGSGGEAAAGAGAAASSTGVDHSESIDAVLKRGTPTSHSG